MKFILTCGGTAGHINPAIAVAECLKKRMPESEFLFIGAEGQMETELVPRSGYRIESVKITNLSRGHTLNDFSHNLDTVKNVAVSTAESRKIIRDFHPDAVIGTGGYVCFPVITAAHELHIKTFIHESNAVPGLTTKLLSGIVDCVFLGVSSAEENYKRVKTVYTGTPVRNGFSELDRDRVRMEMGLQENDKLVLSVWGSLGSGFMNEIVHEMIPHISSESFRMIHSTGKSYYQNFTDVIDINGFSSNGSVEVHDYLYDIPRLMIASDLVMCRGGASTLAELTYLGKPALIVPSPNVTNNHQEKNARVLEQAGAARVMLETDLTAERMLACINDMVSDEEYLKVCSDNMRLSGRRDSADFIAESILSQLMSE